MGSDLKQTNRARIQGPVFCFFFLFLKHFHSCGRDNGSNNKTDSNHFLVNRAYYFFKVIFNSILISNLGLESSKKLFNFF